jgi:ribonucleoside-triphosphate reductase
MANAGTYADHESGAYAESHSRLEVGNIIPFEQKVMAAVARDEYHTIDLQKIRNVLTKAPFKLDDGFIAKYEGKEPKWGELGWFTFKRTYARRVEKEDGTSTRTEEWTEVVRRVVEGNLSILPEDPLTTQEYGQMLYNLIWNLVFTPPGRGLWMSGSEFARRSGDSMNNCWFVATRPWHYGETNKIFTVTEIDPQEKRVSYPFVFLFDMAMKGGGVGFSVEDEDLAMIPKVKNKVELFFFLNREHADFEEVEAMAKATGAKFNESVLVKEGEEAHIIDFEIPDQREGWAEALAVTIDEHFSKNPSARTIVCFDLTKIRKRGTPIRGFGGVASGSAPLLQLLQFYNLLFNKFIGRQLTSEAGTDLHNATGKCVVAGNVRRTAEVALASPYDQSFIDLKNYTLYAWLGGWRDRGDGEWEQYSHSDEDLLEQGYTEEAIDEARYQVFAQQNHRWASNNSVVIDDPRGYKWVFISPGIEANGEPGILNRWLMQNFGRIIDGYREMLDKAKGGNPCMEISLESGEPCNLTELFLPVMYELGIDPSEVLPLMVHYTKRVTFSPYEWELSREVITRNRRLGISLSGFIDWVLLKYGKSAIRGWKVYSKQDWHDMEWLENGIVAYEYSEGTVPPHYDPETQVIEPDYKPELVAELDRMYKIVKQADIEYSAILTRFLGYLVEPSIKLTTVKPSGTVALLPFVSPGVHSHYFRYGIRRIQVQSNDPLLGLATLAGYKAEPYNKSPETTSVIEFPVKAPTADCEDFRDCSEVTIEEQFALQALLCIYWADNMVSCTITFQDAEKPKIKHLLEQYRMRIKSTSLLPYAGHGYVQAPYQPMTKEWYEEARKGINFAPHELYHILMNSAEGFEDQEMTLSEALECANGACPTR